MGDDGEVEVAVLDPVDQVGRRLAHDRDLGLRIRTREARQDFRKVAVRIVVRQPEPHPPDEFAFREGRDAFRVQAHDPARIVEEALAFLGQPRGPSIPLEDRSADPLLQPLHLHRNGALRLVDDLRRTGEGARIGNGDEGAELVDVEKVHDRLY